mmetsp:Transcript_15956/g.24712  ORF Transcript_15956/g.24712 Transcript_15956/m.24712 type:complete len:186 (-) Transcript_15956:184-741(-)|eukprot:CAMPEP_0170497828 /NCGR_PEP_ID=MMETSP0208-20121228/25953_1 /TAXON_ID=197538 /ORGANISM="Strombidium inclinatum, Strain S3" /LENGTH=185 /DNA_ID=CAMNT_0010774775 /DNA_START=785 /DNA_END=1342 /DNA_ORIENTATION=-
MITTLTHSKSFINDLNDPSIRKWWDMFFINTIDSWKAWHEYWLDHIANSKVPVFFFRFEDLLLSPEPVLKDMFKFILASDDLDGSVIEKRIGDVINKGGNFLYKPRAAGGGFHKHEDKLTSEQMAYLREQLKPLLHYFGYTKDERVLGLNKFEFYDFDGEASESDKESYMNFLDVNKEMLKRRID